ncbi:uncharacterized protein K441DRAFT_701451 [Cenococcum geophilum 1.58]|uniref:Uncharacterized protein n=1 Tax=Cenococcum geophilum 1.58 TaxID=794803 RepID=A0ACC8ELI9_9PEZI|nr:hypothetical protein K441DRAFT_701451 [Cenococcum geophilum 1.58]
MAYGSSLYYGGGFISRDWTQTDDESRNFSLCEAFVNVSGLSGPRGFSGGPRGGWRGPDPSVDKNIQERQWNANAPAWRIAVEGLSLEAHCRNGSCPAYNQGYILVKWGYRNGGVFDIFRNDRDANCPMCNMYVEVENFGFTNTRYKVVGSKKDNPHAPLQDVNTDWKLVSGDYYTTFLDDPNSLVNWGQLRIEVQRP